MGDYSYPDILNQIIGGADLSVRQAHWVFGQVMGGKLSEAQIAGLLTALAAKGETVEELAGAAQAMRDHVVRVDTRGADVVDTCGTGGTGISTFNISTAAAMVAAGAGLKVAKHGNHTNTRASGSANVLSALGVNIECDAITEGRCLAEANICFSFAVKHHPAMKYAGPVRKQLGVRTIFNFLGPLTNPAGANRQLMGVAKEGLVEVIAQVLATLGASRAMVVHSADGLDEISTTAPTRVAELIDGKITTRTLDAADLGLKRAALSDLLVDSAERSADVVRHVLAGHDGPAREIVLINAAAALVVGGKAGDLPEGLEQARASIASGAAADALQKLIRISNS